MNKEERKEYNKKYYKANKDKIKEYKRNYRKKNKEKIREYNRKYFQENKEKVLKRQYEYELRKLYLSYNENIPDNYNSQEMEYRV